MYTHTEENFLPAEVVLTQASSGKRLANYLIDLAVFYAFTFLIGVVLFLAFDQFILEYEDTAINTLLDRLISMVLYGMLMGLTEGICKGKSLGKLITGTRAVKADGSTLDFGTAFKRGLCRMVPFNELSGLGNPCTPWHDRWTDTLVIDEKRSDTSALTEI